MTHDHRHDRDWQAQDRDCGPLGHHIHRLRMAARHGGGPRGGPFQRGFGGPGGFGFGPFGRGPRARRGDIRAAILALLKEEPRNGYQIIQVLKERSGGLWNASPGSVYPTLQQLEDERLIGAQETPGGRVFALTKEGIAYVAAHAEEVAAPWEALSQAAGGDFIDLMGLSRQLAVAAMQVAQSGEAADVAKARKILAEARRSLYQILAEGAAGEEA
ncbi:MAG: PadR family transcriptional regulator [Bauldia sp.]